MKVIKQLPPNIDKIKAAIKLKDWDEQIKVRGTVFTYGDAIYNPSDARLPDHLLIHEEQHMKQQGADPEAWWDKYLADKDFRFENELEAYIRQYKFVLAQNYPAKLKKLLLDNFAADLCSEQYGLGKNLAKVESAIRNGAKQ